MKNNQKIYLFVIFFILLLIYWGCNELVVDNSLSPPTIGKPIYNCSEIISYSGADRDAKIRVYVNGTEVMEINTWMGWGSIKLPSPLSSGDIVSATQIIDNRISVQTREPVTVENVPPDKMIGGEKLITPQIVSPLYECQKCIMVENVVQGATVRLGENSVEIKDGTSPYSIIRFGMPELKFDDGYEAWQEICLKLGGYTSDHSAKEKVKKKPESLLTPKIHEPIVAGNDACQVNDLFFGAAVKIFAVNASGETQVGGGTALSSATIYHINPPFDLNYSYYAKQYLCELESDPSDKIPLEKEVPAPIIKEPICNEDIYITICNTVVLSTIKVFVNGTQVAQAAGNGGCVRIAVGDATVFSTGQKIESQQFVFGASSPMSTQVIVKPDGAPPYEPAYWNDPGIVRCNNCYNYGCNIRTDNYAQPGYAHNVSHTKTCPTVILAAIADGLAKTNIDKRCEKCTHIVALVIAPNEDYHWYRLDDNGRWSHKMAIYPASDQDGAGNLITNPETANRKVYNGPDIVRDYNIFCGYFCVDKNNVVIAGSYTCNN